MNLDKELNKIEKNLNKELRKTERWFIERRKFLIKFGIVAGFIILLIIFSNLYLKTKGFG